MALKFQLVSRISRRILTLHPSNCGYRRYSVSLNLQRKSLLGKINDVRQGRNPSVHRYSTVTSVVHEPPALDELSSFIYSSLDEVEGPSHRWLNNVEGSKCGFKKDGIFFICATEFLGDCTSSDCNPLTVFEKVKLLKQRYPSLQVMGLQYFPSILSDAACTNLIRRIMTEYITFPVLLSNKDYSEKIHGACYIMFKGLQSPLIYHDKDVDFATLDKAAANTLIMENGEVSTLASKLQSSWMNPVHIVKEPYLSSFLQNLLLYFPACISSDEEGNRLFLSDVNHHRIIILNENGNILDCIGSSPGFEDAEFENAKLMRPAASFYHSQEDCLYFVDSENHAVRKADLERRIVETVFPPSTVKKNTSFWSWILDNLGKKSETKINPDEIDSDSCFVPWHLIKSTNDELFVLSRGLGSLWMIDMGLGITKVVRGLPEVLEICGHMMIEKSSLVKRIPKDWLQQQQRDATCWGDAIPYAGLMSSVAKLKDYVFLCDSGGQMVLKLNQKNGSLSRLQFSNFDILGLPYWLSLPLERVCLVDEMVSKLHVDHSELFHLLPGRVNIKINIEIPEYLVLVEPLGESSVWCQARGSATDVSGAESGAPSSEKVGIAQKWYDELDSLAFSTSESDSISDVASTDSAVEMQEGRICIRYSISTSPGTSEAIIYAPMYVRLKRNSTSSSQNDLKYANQLANILDPVRVRWQDSFGKFLLASTRDLEGSTFIKPLHIRLKFDCGEHPKAENSKSIILTDSSVEVNAVIR